MENTINKLIFGSKLENGLESIGDMQKWLSLLIAKDYDWVGVIIEQMAEKQIKSGRFGVDSWVLSSFLMIDRWFNEIIEEMNNRELISPITNPIDEI